MEFVSKVGRVTEVHRIHRGIKRLATPGWFKYWLGRKIRTIIAKESAVLPTRQRVKWIVWCSNKTCGATREKVFRNLGIKRASFWAEPCCHYRDDGTGACINKQFANYHQDRERYFSLVQNQCLSSHRMTYDLHNFGCALSWLYDVTKVSWYLKPLHFGTTDALRGSKDEEAFSLRSKGKRNLSKPIYS